MYYDYYLIHKLPRISLNICLLLKHDKNLTTPKNHWLLKVVF